MLDEATTVPLRRLGALLRVARGEVGLDEVARRSAGRYEVAELVEIESGEVSLTDDQVRELLAIYRADPGELASSRSTLVVDLDEGTVAAGPWATSFQPDADTTDDVLARYLALVYEMRGIEPGTPVPLRTLDISVLSDALELPTFDVEARLHILMDADDGRVEQLRALLRRRVLVPAIGLVVGVTGLGVLLLVPGARTDPAPGAELGRAASVMASDTMVVIGSGLTIEAPSPPAVTEPEAPAVTSSDATEPEPAPAPGTDTETGIGEGLTIEAPELDPPPDGGVAVQPAEPPATGTEDPEVVIGEGLTIERSDLD